MAQSEWGAIFDWDGVVVDSAVQHQTSWQQLAHEEGFAFPEEHFKRGYGKKNDDIFRELLGIHDAREISRMSQRKEGLFRQLVQERGMKLCPGVREWLTALQQAGIPCAVGSSTPRLNITCVLERLGVTEAFRAVVSSEDVTCGKPDPQVFALAASRLGVPAARCVVFEDTPIGIQAARAAGMKVVGVVTTHAAHALQGADRLVQRLDELTIPDVGRWFQEPPP